MYDKTNQTLLQLQYLKLVNDWLKFAQEEAFGRLSVLSLIRSFIAVFRSEHVAGLLEIHLLVLQSFHFGTAIHDIGQFLPFSEQKHVSVMLAVKFPNLSYNLSQYT